MLCPDKPLENPENDRLGYAPFAKHLAESLVKITPTDGMVIAVCGPWGSGKTTFLNFVEYYIKQKPEKEQPIITKFNPWWFSGQENLIRRFFEQLEIALKKRKIFPRKLKKVLAEFFNLISKTPISHSAIVEIIIEKLKIIARLISPEWKDVSELKSQLIKSFKEQNKRILMFIDDIDRLTAEEIRQLFRVIKAVADFPNVIYLLTFDKKVVVKALSEVQGISGEKYLEKIVQAIFKLPDFDKISLRNLLLEKLFIILSDTPPELFDKDYWNNVYLEGIDPFINTPRDVLRLVNALSVTYPAVKGEVNFTDFVAVETLRVFCPQIYDVIRGNPEIFTGCVDSSSYGIQELEKLKPICDTWLDIIPKEHRESVKNLLMRLFPKLEAVWRGGIYGAGWEKIWNKKRRICSPSVFHIYFRLSVPEGSISRGEMISIINMMNNPKAFSSKLMEFAKQKGPQGITKARILFEMLWYHDYVKDIPKESIPSVIQVLFNIGDYLLEQENKSYNVLINLEFIIILIINSLLMRMNETKRYEILKNAVEDGKAITLIVREIEFINYKRNGKQSFQSAEKLLKEDYIHELEKITLEKIRDAAKDYSLLQADGLDFILSYWTKLAGDKEVKLWIKKAISEDGRFILFLGKFIGKIFFAVDSDIVSRVGYRFNLDAIKPYFEESEITKLVDRARDLIKKESLSEDQRKILSLFIQEYENQLKKPDKRSYF